MSGAGLPLERQEYSAKLITGYIVYFERRLGSEGTRALLRRAGIELDYARHSSNWIGWDRLESLHKVLREEYGPGGDISNHAAHLTMEAQTGEPIFLVFSSMAGPRSVYKDIGRLARYFNRIDQADALNVTDRSATIELSLANPTDYFVENYRTWQGYLEGIPTLFGLPMARCEITLQNQSKAIFELEWTPRKSIRIDTSLKVLGFCGVYAGSVLALAPSVGPLAYALYAALSAYVATAVFFRLKAENDVLRSRSTRLSEFFLSSDQRYGDLITHQKKLSDAEAKASISEELSALAAQVAHDIRSPLAALSVATSDLDTLAEDHRQLIEQSVSRIRAIADDLLARFRQKNHRPDTPRSIAPTFINEAIQLVVGEKRTQNRTNKLLRIECFLHGIPFCAVSPVELQRMISNLVDNSVDAGANRIGLEVAVLDRKVRLRLKDNGPGIPEEIKDQVGKQRVTFGKPTGSGLGLMHAFDSVKKWSGTLDITSGPSGTEIHVDLPLVSLPRWHIHEIRLSTNTNFVVVDDDPSIALLWKKRFAEVTAKKIEVLEFTDPKAFLDWSLGPDRPRAAFCAIDHDFHGLSLSGLELIRSIHSIVPCSLVTSRADDPRIQARCLEAGIPLLPKSQISQVPITFHA